MKIFHFYVICISTTTPLLAHKVYLFNLMYSSMVVYVVNILFGAALVLQVQVAIQVQSKVKVHES